MTDDELYRYYALDIGRDNAIDSVHRRYLRSQDETKMPIWLQDAGLWETWHIITSTKTIRSVGYRGEL